MHTASVQRAIATIAAGSYRFEDLIPLEQGKAHFGPPRFYRQRKRLVAASVSVPIESQAGKRVGVLMGRFKLNHLIEAVAD